MPKKTPDQPPADALPLAEAFRRFTDPQLLDVLDRLEAAGANVPPRQASLPVAFYSPAWMDQPPPPRSYTTNPRWSEYCRVLAAAEADFGDQLRAGELRAWGREDAAWGKWRAVPPDAWKHLAVVNWPAGNVRSGPKTAATHLFGVLVARLARPAKPGPKPLADQEAPLIEEMRKMILADPTLTASAALRRLAAAGWKIPGRGTLENRMDRVVGHFYDRKINPA